MESVIIYDQLDMMTKLIITMVLYVFIIKVTTQVYIDF